MYHVIGQPQHETSARRRLLLHGLLLAKLFILVFEIPEGMQCDATAAEAKHLILAELRSTAPSDQPNVLVIQCAPKLSQSLVEAVIAGIKDEADFLWQSACLDADGVRLLLWSIRTNEHFFLVKHSAGNSANQPEHVVVGKLSLGGLDGFGRGRFGRTETRTRAASAASGLQLVLLGASRYRWRTRMQVVGVELSMSSASSSSTECL